MLKDLSIKQVLKNRHVSQILCLKNDLFFTITPKFIYANSHRITIYMGETFRIRLKISPDFSPF